MKLFAVLAASATAMRVNTPAPGFVNEQGAYFADQSSDQSVQRPQQPQLPQVQPPHSTQAPQPGQEDADRDWPQGRQYPRGEGKGRTNEQGGWWPDQNGDNNPVDPDPVDPDQDPRPIEECMASAQNAPNDVFMIKDDIQTCRLSNVMRQHVSLQLEWVLKDLEDEKKRELQLAFTLAINEWSNLADNNKCNFAGNMGPGILANCGTICMGIKGHGQPEGFNKTPVGFQATMNAFAQYVADNFGSNTHREPAANRDECGEKLNALFKNISKFEEITGNIDFIPINPFFFEDNLN